MLAALALAGSAIVVGSAMRGHSGGSAPRGAAPVATPDDGHQRGTDAASAVPVSFIENRGQTDASVRYYAQGDRFAFYLTRSAVMLTFAKQPVGAAVSGQAGDELALALRFVGADPDVDPQGVDRVAGVVNDLRGGDPSRWRTSVPLFRDVVYADLWPNIDLRLREQSGVLEVRVPRASGRLAARHRARLRRSAGPRP